jgi:hypothetical protein
MCPDGLLPLLEDGTTECVPPDATCPRDTRRMGRECKRTPTCPAGTLLDGDRCHAFVHEGRGGAMVVDLALWSALALGRVGGIGTALLCRPLQQRPKLYAFLANAPWRVALAMRFDVPDGDLAAVTVSVKVEPEGGKSLSLAATGLAQQAAESLVETLRCVGGTSSLSRFETDVWCEAQAR